MIQKNIRITFSFFLSFLFLIVNAQPIITSTGVNPSIGDSIIIVKNGLFDSRTINPPISNGQNLNWNYSNLNDTNSIYKTSLKINASNGFVRSFATNQLYPQNLISANAYIYDSYNSIFFIIMDSISNNSWKYAGSYESFPTSGNFTFKDSLHKPLSRLIYPMTFGTINTDSTLSTETTGNTSKVVKIYDTIRYEAFGTLNLPNGIFNDVILVTNSRKRINSSISNAGTDGYNIEYTFFKNGFNYPLLRIFKYTPTKWAAYYYVRNSNRVLPLNFGNIFAEYKNGSVILKWNTTNEMNLKKFIIQHSSDGITFSDIANIDSKGQNVNSYEFVHNALTRRLNYYRIKSVDIDNSFQFSKTVIIDVNQKTDFSIHPNPAKDYLQIEFKTRINNAKITIISPLGNIILSETKSNILDNHRLNISRINNGIYFLNIETEFGSYTRKIIVNN